MKNAKSLLLVLGSTRRIRDASMRTIILLFATLLGLSAQPGIAGVYDPYTGPDPVAPSLRLMAEPFAAAEALGPVSVSIRSLNAQTFPFVFLDVDATDETGTCPLFNAENFQVLEDGVAQTDYFAVTPPNENQGVRLVDVVFIMDNSGSMGDDQLAVQNNVYGFVDKLTQAGINFAFGLTRYGQGASSGAPIIEDNGNLTSDAGYFKDTLWTRNTIDGGLEPGYWAIVESAAKFNYRPGSRRVFIIITDENPNQGGATLDQAAAALQNGDVTLFAVTETALFSSFQSLVADPTQQLLGLTASFDQIFTAVTDLLADTYRVTYKAQNETIDGLERTVEVRVTCGADMGSDTTTYVPGSAPKITRTQETVALSETTQPDQVALTIAAQVTDQVEPFVQPGGVNLNYRTTSTINSAPYRSTMMTSIGGDTYSAEIPAEDVTNPGIDYYISATDGMSTSTDPKVLASSTPYTIAVFPNAPPQIVHDVITEAQESTPLRICAEAVDTTDALADVPLYFRERGELIFEKLAMVQDAIGICVGYGTAQTYYATIPKERVVSRGIEYFLEAVDNYGVRATSGSADEPHFVVITNLTTSSFSVIPHKLVQSEGTNYSRCTEFSFFIERTGDLTQPASVNWYMDILGPSVHRVDFCDWEEPRGTVVFEADQARSLVKLGIYADGEYEYDELFVLKLSSNTATDGVDPVHGVATGVILNDDPRQLFQVPGGDQRHPLVVAGSFANAAYSDVPLDELLVYGWVPVSSTFIGQPVGASYSDAYYQEGVFRVTFNLTSALGYEQVALLYEGLLRGKRTLIVAFRGTQEDEIRDKLFELARQLLAWKDIYRHVEDFVNEVVSYAKDAEFEQILVTGHSLGGALSQQFVADLAANGFDGDEVIAITFGSPGGDRQDNGDTMGIGGIPLLNIIHTDDSVPNEVNAIQPGIRYGADLHIERTGGDGVLMLRFYEHSMKLYLESASGLIAGLNKAHLPISLADFREFIAPTYVIGVPGVGDSLVVGSLDADGGVPRLLVGGAKADSVIGDTGLIGVPSGDVLIGGDGNDKLYGLSKVDVLIEGPGNDYNAGGTGVDLYVALGNRSDYRIESKKPSLERAVTMWDQNRANGDGGKDELVGVEVLLFDDGFCDLQRFNSCSAESGTLLPRSVDSLVNYGVSEGLARLLVEGRATHVP